MSIMKYVSTTWLSLATAVERALKVYDGLCSYFRSEKESQARFKRLKVLFSSPMIIFLSVVTYSINSF